MLEKALNQARLATISGTRPYLCAYPSIDTFFYFKSIVLLREHKKGLATVKN